MDKEYIVLSEIDKNSKITQRELSKMIQCSLGSINILLSKMVKDELIKIERLPMNRILYILTPKGVVEKLQKTSSYIKHNYNYIIDIQTKIRIAIEDIAARQGDIFILLEEDEVSELVRLSVPANKDIKFLTQVDTLAKEVDIVVTNISTYNELKDKYKNVINLIELI